MPDTIPDLKARLGVTDEAELAQLRGMTIPSLRNERARGKGPPFVKIGNKIFYPLKDLQKFMAAHTVRPTAAGRTA